MVFLRYMCILQWNCTFMGVNTGSVSAYDFCSKDKPVASLSSGRSDRANFSRCAFVPGNKDIMVTASDDGMVSKT